MTSVRVSVPLLLDSRLTAAAKLLWLTMFAAGTWPATRARLGRQAGLNHITVRRALAQLAATGWYSENGGPIAPPNCAWVEIPDRLLSAPAPGARAKLMYGILQTVPGFEQRRGQARLNFLSQYTGLDPLTIRQAVGQLVEHRWLKISKAGRLSPIAFSLWAPDREQSEDEAALAEQRIRTAVSRQTGHGEAVMREYLSLLIDSDEFTNNARPGWLINPQTNELLELDRYYPPKVAFDYNGLQHYETTDRYPDAKEPWRPHPRAHAPEGGRHWTATA